MSRSRIVRGVIGSLRNRASASSTSKASRGGRGGRGGTGKVRGRGGAYADEIAEGLAEAEEIDAEREKEERLKAYRKEANRLVSMANKRLRRLENAGLTDTPAYQQFLEYGQPKFSVKNKNFNELQREVSRMKKFLDAKTSTIRGANKVLKDMAKNTGIKYKNLKELREQASNFFELASKVEQYLRNTNDSASAIGYQKIWVAINQYTKDNKKALDLSKSDMEKAIKEISKALDELGEQEHQSRQSRGLNGGFWKTLK